MVEEVKVVAETLLKPWQFLGSVTSYHFCDISAAVSASNYFYKFDSKSLFIFSVSFYNLLSSGCHPYHIKVHRVDGRSRLH